MFIGRILVIVMILDDEGGGLKNYTTKIIFFFTKYINFPQFRELNLLKNGQTYMGKILLKKRGGEYFCEKIYNPDVSDNFWKKLIFGLNLPLTY